MLEAAVQAISAGVPMGADRPRLLAVTILTSMDQKAMKEVASAERRNCARKAGATRQKRRCGWRGGIGAGSQGIRRVCGREFLIVTRESGQ